MWSNVAALPCPQQTNDLTAARLNVSGGGRYIGGGNEKFCTFEDFPKHAQGESHIT